MENLASLLQDPELLQAFQDPEVAAAFQDVSSNPANLKKYENNPKIKKIFDKMAKKFGAPDVDDDVTEDPGAGFTGSSTSTKPTPHVPTQPDID
jgi:suppressor of tumorigenicity protein 13